MSDRPVKLTRHADHDPGLTCRPALGYGLCEVLEPAGVRSTGRCAAANWCLMSETCERLPDCEGAS